MAATITMPKLGLTMNSGSVQEWKKNIGDTVAKGEILFTVATDKLTVDVESTDSGTLLAYLVEIGQDVEVGGGVALIGEAGEQVSAAASSAVSPAASQTASAQEAAPDTAKASAESAGSQSSAPAGAAAAATPSTQAAPCCSGSGAKAGREGRVASSPKAKKLAREKGIDINSLQGSGPDGWVVAKDVLAAAESGNAPKVSPLAAKMAAGAGLDLSSVSASGPGGKIMKDDLIAAAKKILAEAGISTGAAAGSEQRLPKTQMRKVIGERMLASTSGIPSVNYFTEVDMTALNEFRASCNARVAKSGGVKISVNDIIMKFCAKLLMEHPLLNGSVEQDAFVLRDYANIGFAVALPGGLLVPNIKNAQSKSLGQLAAERVELVERARSGALSPDEMAHGTFTISNLGSMGIDTFTPIINAPEVAILGVGSTREKPAVVDGAVVPRPIAVLSLTADHRLVDGADAAPFLARLKELIENPNIFLL